MKNTKNIITSILLLIFLGSTITASAQMFGGMPITKNTSTVQFKSCLEIKNADSSASNGLYWIDPDGLGSNQPFQVVCDMTSRGGGWTLILKSMASNTDFFYSSSNWTTGTIFNFTDFDITNSSNTNALYNSYNLVTGTSFWVDFLNTNDIEPMNIGTALTPKTVATGGTIVIDQTFGCFTNIPNSMISANQFGHGRGYASRSINRGWGWDCGSSDCIAQIRFGVITNNETDSSSSDCSIGIGLDGIKFQNNGSGSIFNNEAASCGTAPRPDSGFQKTLLWVR